MNLLVLIFLVWNINGITIYLDVTGYDVENCSVIIFPCKTYYQPEVGSRVIIYNHLQLSTETNISGITLSGRLNWCLLSFGNNSSFNANGYICSSSDNSVLEHFNLILSSKICMKFLFCNLFL
jgi:hypothetical protein